MDELQIKNILCKTLGNCFKGVYSMDEWRTLKKKANPCAYVFNTQPSSVRFGHWIGIYIQKNGKAIFFDSFGRSPESLGFLLFLEKHAKTWQYNNIPVQSPFSGVCGQHVICFFLYIQNISAWLKLFHSSSLLSNDNTVHEMINNKFNINAPLYPDIQVLM